MSSGDTWDVRYLPGQQFSAVAACTEGWPTFAQTWLGGEFPSRRPAQMPGWVCGGCGRGFAPFVRECRYCPEQVAANQPGSPRSRDLTWTPDASEPDGS